MVRSFEVRAKKPSLVCNLAQELDRELMSLQDNNWKIISVTSCPIKEYDYPSSFDSMLFVIVAEKADYKKFKTDKERRIKI